MRRPRIFALRGAERTAGHRPRTPAREVGAGGPMLDPVWRRIYGHPSGKVHRVFGRRP